MHYTAADFGDSVRLLTANAASAHYLVPYLTDRSYSEAGFDKVEIFNLVDETERAWHAGMSSWQGRTNLNDSSIGIEAVNLASETAGIFSFPSFGPFQIDAIAQLAANILSRYPDISPTRVVGHSDIAYTRKSDPGPAFPWRDLYLRGVGAWYDEATKAEFYETFTKSGLPSHADLLASFERYGYAVPEIDDEGSISLMIRAFQMHFRPERYDGVIDVETAAILYALNAKYGS
jgi:N-acetylmuramoyl-L-alanine amidase